VGEGPSLALFPRHDAQASGRGCGFQTAIELCGM